MLPELIRTEWGHVVTVGTTQVLFAGEENEENFDLCNALPACFYNVQSECIDC